MFLCEEFPECARRTSFFAARLGALYAWRGVLSFVLCPYNSCALEHVFAVRTRMGLY